MSDAVKKLDALTGHRVGDFFRKRTNANTRDYWDRRFASFDGGNWRDFNYQILAQFLPADGNFSLLDVGSALGDGCLFLRQKFPAARISGCDFSPVAVGKAKEKAKGKDVDFFVLDILRDNPPARYDYIVTLSTLEHFDDPLSVVDKCLDRVNRAMLIMVPYEKEFANPRLYTKGEHRFLFNEKSFEEYRSEVLQVTDVFKESGHRYILFRIEPQRQERA